jgi:hypothetical protein
MCPRAGLSLRRYNQQLWCRIPGLFWLLFFVVSFSDPINIRYVNDLREPQDTLLTHSLTLMFRFWLFLKASLLHLFPLQPAQSNDFCASCSQNYILSALLLACCSKNKGFYWPSPSGVDSASNRDGYRGFFLRGKGCRCLGLTTLPPSCADCLKIQHSGAHGACLGLFRESYTFTHLLSGLVTRF